MKRIMCLVSFLALILNTSAQTFYWADNDYTGPYGGYYLASSLSEAVSNTVALNSWPDCGWVAEGDPPWGYPTEGFAFYGNTQGPAAISWEGYGWAETSYGPWMVKWKFDFNEIGGAEAAANEVVGQLVQSAKLAVDCGVYQIPSATTTKPGKRNRFSAHHTVSTILILTAMVGCVVAGSSRKHGKGHAK